LKVRLLTGRVQNKQSTGFNLFVLRALLASAEKESLNAGEVAFQTRVRPKAFFMWARGKVGLR